MELPENNAHTPIVLGDLPGAAASALSMGFLDEGSCRAWLLGRFHGTRAFCPGCGVELSGVPGRNFWDGRRVKCPDCGKGFSAVTGTVMSGAALSFRKVFLLAALLGMGLENRDIAARVECSSENVRLWRRRFCVLQNQGGMRDGQG